MSATIAPNRHRRGLPEMWGQLLARRLYRPPRRRHHRTPSEFGVDFRVVTATTADGIALHCWVIPGSGRGRAVLGHGIGLSKSASLAQAALLHENGYGVVLFDHRNHGLSGSDGAVTGLADRFTDDVRAAIAVAGTELDGSGPTLTWGFSFSTFPSLYLLRDPDVGVDGLLCDSGPALSLQPLFDGFAASGMMPIPIGLRGPSRRSRVLTTAADTATRMLGAQWPPPADAGRLGRIPMLLITGSQDPIVPSDQVRALAAHYPRASVCELAGAHLDTIKRDPQGYRSAVSAYLDELESR